MIIAYASIVFALVALPVALVLVVQGKKSGVLLGVPVSRLSWVFAGVSAAFLAVVVVTTVPQILAGANDTASLDRQLAPVLARHYPGWTSEAFSY